MGGGGGGTTTQSGDPAVSAFNELTLNEIRRLLPQVGGLPGALAPRALALPGQAERGLLSTIAARGQMPVFGPTGSTFNRITESLLPSAQQTFERIVAPATLNRLTAAGFSPGSGAVTEALANAGADLANQVTQMAAGLAPQIAQQELGMLGTSLSALEAPRLAQLGEESRAADFLIQLLGRGITPSGAGTATQTLRPDRSQQLTSLIGTGLLGAGMIFGCWIARAIYGDHDPRWRLARAFIFEHWHGPVADVVRRLYVRYGPALAPYVRRHRWLRAALKPLFDLAVRRAMRRVTLVGVTR